MRNEIHGSWLMRRGGSALVLPSDSEMEYNIMLLALAEARFLCAMAWRYMEQDFRMRSTYGSVEGSTLDDWPISYQDLEPYYEKAEWEIGVSGDDSNNIFRAPRKRPLPMPPLPPNREYTILKPQPSA